MQLGVKIALQSWQEVLQTTQAQYCEVLFRLDLAAKFTPMFDHLRTHHVSFGLHFWASLPGGFEPNLAFEPQGIADHSHQLMAQTLKLASQVGAAYINIHPGSLTLTKIDLDHQSMALVPDAKVTPEQALQSLLARTRQLRQLADSLNLLFLVETLPKHGASHWRDDSGRLKVILSHNISPDMILHLAQAGQFITNDFGHTTASWVTDDMNQLWRHVYSTSRQLAPQTKLIHLNTIAPPFNGTDSHAGVLPADFTAGVFPNRNQILDLLHLYQNRDDIWIIPEPPAETMVQNYHAIKALLQEI
ncbi:MAG: hypothetical protein HY381_00305 [Candidatus Chisholmbacteria bacterium]|nr:hypothetical protein [Candidatus Chisholmbacteria bacterium]